MTRVRILLALFFIVIIRTQAFSQNKINQTISISGYVKDSLSNKSLEYPTVVLISDSMKIVIIEDEPQAAQRLGKLVKALEPAAEVVAVMDSVKQSVAWFKKDIAADLIFMDIEMPLLKLKP